MDRAAWRQRNYRDRKVTQYALRAEFLTTAAAPLGTYSTIGGTLVFTDTNSKWTVGSTGLAWAADTAVSGFWGGQAFTRVLGRHMHLAFTASDVSDFYFGWRTAQSLAATMQPGIGSAAASGLRMGNWLATPDAALPSPFSTATRYEFILILRAAGSFILFRAASTGTWKLAMVERVSAGATIYPILFNNAATASSAGVCHFLKIPRDLWYPAPIVSDSFTRADSSTLGLTDGRGDAESPGGSGLAWEEVTGDSSIASNALAVPDSGIATVDSGLANVLVDCTLTPDATARGIAFRVSDASNFWRATITSGGVLNITKVVAGSATSAANTTGVTTGSGERLVVVADGNAITAFYFGASVATRIAVASDAFNATATKHGSYQATIDNFNVWPRSITYPLAA